MYIQNISPLHCGASQHIIKKKNNTIYCSSNLTYNPVYYKDYNISFGGRTPEDFYAQSFNMNNMPSTMKDYLFYDYENRQHIPPEQMMKEVYKYIEIADNFEDVKSIYPTEDLFAGLHDNRKKSRKDILSEIDAVRDLSDAPLLKDGNNNFGLYLLKKIYLEGKTLKEIDKDFHEKDINEEYKEIITEPVKYSTLDAYGICYPNQAFWHSFIHTRDEYKKFFVTLPKDTFIPGVNVVSSGGIASSIQMSEIKETDKPKMPKRRFKIKNYQKEGIKKDLVTKRSTNIEFVKKTIRKRFAKDDPEASFIFRYLSPIMTVASDRAHMSQEIKGFAEYERMAGKSMDAETLFGRFWKNNPKMLEVFSSAITDTMDMFEDIYGSGGLIPINTDLEKITDDTDNKKIIDYVSPEFLELLDYAKNIDILRNEKYVLHDKLQKQWNEHFINRYGESVTDVSSAIVLQEPTKTELSQEQRQKVEEEKDGANVHKLRLKDGNYIYITSDPDEILKGEVKYWARYYPTKYANNYIKSTLSQDFSDRFKLTFAVRHKNLQLPNNERMEFDDEKLQSDEEFNADTYKLTNYHFNHPILEHAARFALIDTMLSINDINAPDSGIYNMNIADIDGRLVVEDSSKEDFDSLLISNKKNIDRKFASYSTPLTSSEMDKAVNILFDSIAKYNPEKTILDEKDSIVLISMLKDALKLERNHKSCDLFFRSLFKFDTFVKSLLSKSRNDEFQQAKFEAIMDYLCNVIISTIAKAPDIIALFNKDIYSNYRSDLSPRTRAIFDDATMKLCFDGRTAFFGVNENQLNNFI